MPCKMLSPVIDAIAEERKDVKICKINIDEEQELAIRFGIMSIPTVMVFKDGKVAGKSIGLVSKEEILSLL